MTQVGTINGLRTRTIQPDNLSAMLPVAFPVLETVDYHRAFSGGDVVMQWKVSVITGRWTDRTAHALLDSYLSYDGASSIRAALESDRTLGGVVQTSIVQNSTNISSLEVADQEFLEIGFTVTVHA